MCGVFLVYSKKNSLKKSDCSKVALSLKNRGPSELYYNYFKNNKLFICNTLLPITGKILKKNNNLYNIDNKFITFNGEIYNYRKLENKFLKKNNYNDTQVLLNLHKHLAHKKIPKLLDGMYAYIIFDKERNLIEFCTDPQGEKRILKYEDDNFFILSSNIKAINVFLKNNLKINTNILKDYFSFRHFLQLKKTIYDNLEYTQNGFFYNFNLNNLTLHSEQIIDPTMWINKKTYNKYKKIGIYKCSLLLEKLIDKKLNIMTPTINFSSMFSGGIDSGITSSKFSKHPLHKHYLCLNNEDKELPVINFKKGLFDSYLDNDKKKIIEYNKKKYFSDLKKTYKKILTPFPSHDLPGRNKIFEFIKKKKIKVLFSSDGADEIFGGYELYKHINWSIKKEKIISPYSKFTNSITSENCEFIKNLFNKVFKKYRSFLGQRESIMQSNLFIDYFVQSIGVHNISNDVIAGENSIEIRNVFLNKEIIKFGINLPIKYKINFHYKNINMRTKPILKLIYKRNYSSSLIFKKQGFAGFPNESYKFLGNKKKKIFQNLIKKNESRETFWKKLNLFYFNNYLNLKINLKKIYPNGNL